MQTLTKKIPEGIPLGPYFEKKMRTSGEKMRTLDYPLQPEGFPLELLELTIFSDYSTKDLKKNFEFCLLAIKQKAKEIKDDKIL